MNRPLGPVPPDVIRDAIAQRDFSCAACGYNLRGTDGRACPECGRAIVGTLTVGPRKVVVRRGGRAFYHAGGCAAAAGLVVYSVMALGIACVWVEGYITNFSARADLGVMLLGANLAGVALAGALGVFWTRRRAALEPRSAFERWCWAAGVGAAVCLPTLAMPIVVSILGASW